MEENMLQIKKLTITHIKDNRVLLDNLSFSLNQGDKIAVIGEEGNGKSTLLKLIYDESLVEDYVDYTGEIIKNQIHIGYLPQEIQACDKECSAYDFMCKSGMFYEAEPGELSRISKMLKVPLELFYSEQLMGQMSGGEKIKLQLARLMIEQPDVLLLDEPSNDLDIATVQWLEKFIQDSKVPVLYISHDEMLLENTANKIIHLEQIKRKTQARAMVTRSGYREYVDRRMSSLAHQEQVARNERKEYQKQQEKFRQIQQKVEHQQKVVSRQDPFTGANLRRSMHRVKAYEARFEKEFKKMTEIPETEDAIFIKFGEQVNVPNGKVILDYHLPELMVENRCLAKDVSLYVRGPEKICIIGKNGCGKTTLIRRIAEELGMRKDIKVSYMPQNYEECLDETITPVEFLMETGDKDEVSRIRTYLGSMKYTADEMSHPIGDLSGGQRAKLLLLQMSMSGSEVLILDEPTRNFSPLSSPVIRQMLKGFAGVILSISHDRKYIEEVADKVYELTEKGLELIRE